MQQCSTKFHIVNSGSEQFLFDVEGGRLVHLPIEQSNLIETALQFNDMERAELMGLGLGLLTLPPYRLEAPKRVPLKALSLAVAQKCNLGCTYCYAQQGTFGGEAGDMPTEVAQSAIDRLFAGTQPGDKVTLAFMGGEPLSNRQTLHAATRYAAIEAAARGVGIGFTMTTNATLIRAEDMELFQKFGFMVTVSIDGLQATNDQLRPFLSGKGSFEQVKQRVRSLLDMPNRAYRVFARVTVTPKNLDLPDIMTGLFEMGFDDVMFSPMLSAPSGQEEMQATDFETLLQQLIQCGETFRAEAEQGKILPFSNLTKMLQRIHSREQELYPCGAGGGYMGVSAEGELYACHRFINDDAGHMGSAKQGTDPDKQATWLSGRHLDSQSACTHCWARYLCSGSCHYEVIKRGRPACDYIRGWLHYCLTVYAEMSQQQPEILTKVLK
ncbi:radical SAM protein [Candidatus Albibeggiatoa sp. nov. BB20]|uniref:radical SAM/SPASM domain-containing protein n=1 Tax=Candidatus Albibeggiatoa sp. nov. BB20 TaxID=3162723 RepID=UPI0033655369